MHSSRRAVARLFIVAVLALAMLPGVSQALKTHQNVGAVANFTTPDVGSTSPYPGTINLEGFSGVIHQIFVAINVTHANPDDLDVLLVGPTGVKVVIMSDVGGTGDLTNRFFNINQNIPGVPIPDSGPINQNAFYSATNVGAGDPFPAPAPSGTPSTSTAAFLGTNPNGTWQVFVVDDTAGGGPGSISVQLGLTTEVTTTNGAQITIPTAGAASAYPSTINVPYLAGTIDFIDVILLNVTHSNPNDIDVLLVSPGGTKVRLMSDAGGNQNISNVTLHFSNITNNTLPSGDGIVSGSYNASNYGLGDDDFPPPAPGTPYDDEMNDFLGEHTQGAWKLYVNDDGNNDGGSIGGWSVRLSTLDNTPAVATIANQTMQEGDVLQLNVTATDIDNDPLTMSVLSLPPFANFEDDGNGNGTITFTPESGDAGTYSAISVRATDGDLTGSKSFTLTVTDGTPPVTTATLNPLANAAGWNKTDVAVTLTSTDPAPGSGVASITFSAVGSNTVPTQLENDGQVTLPTFTNEGNTNVSFRGKDVANNTEDFKNQAVKIDKTKPTITVPKEKFVAVTKLNSDTAVPITAFGWVGADALSGLSAFSLQEVTNGGAPQQATLDSPLAPSEVRFLAPGNTYKFRIQSVDVAGNASIVSEGPTFAFDAFQENNVAINYSAGWTDTSAAFAMGGRLAFANTANQTATFSFTGTDVAWVAARGSDRGIAEVRIDGVLKATVDLFNASLQGRRIVFAADALTDAPHTIEIKVLGTKNASSTGTRVDVDAFLTLNPS